MPLKWTNRSRPPSSGVMKPKPLSSLNHLTVPVAIYSPSKRLAFAGRPAPAARPNSDGRKYQGTAVRRSRRLVAAREPRSAALECGLARPLGQERPHGILSRSVGLEWPRPRVRPTSASGLRRPRPRGSGESRTIRLVRPRGRGSAPIGERRRASACARLASKPSSSAGRWLTTSPPLHRRRRHTGTPRSSRTPARARSRRAPRAAASRLRPASAPRPSPPARTRPTRPPQSGRSQARARTPTSDTGRGCAANTTGHGSSRSTRCVSDLDERVEHGIRRRLGDPSWAANSDTSTPPDTTRPSARNRTARGSAASSSSIVPRSARSSASS